MVFAALPQAGEHDANGDVLMPSYARRTDANQSDTSSDGERAFLFYLKTFCPDLPDPDTEYQFHPDRKWRFDFAWPDKKLAVEINGGQWQQGRHTRAGKGYENDLEKMNAAQLAGYTVLQFTPDMINRDPQGCMLLVWAACK